MTEHKMEIAAPCDDCLHEKVCAIKATLEASKATLTIPSLLPSLTPRSLSGVLFVNCSEQLSPDVLKPKRGRPPKERVEPTPISVVDRLLAADEQAAAETFEERRHRLARERADRTWRELHPDAPVQAHA
jgi:hypothetical protein